MPEHRQVLTPDALLMRDIIDRIGSFVADTARDLQPITVGTNLGRMW